MAKKSEKQFTGYVFKLVWVHGLVGLFTLGATLPISALIFLFRMVMYFAIKQDENTNNH